MFQPQPTAFSTFYSDFIPGPIDSFRDEGLSTRERDGSSYSHLHAHSHPQHTHASFNSFQQTHFGAVGATGGVNPGPGPSVGSNSSGPSGGPSPVSGPGGLGHGGVVQVAATPAGVSSRASISTAPLSTFPLHGALPLPQQPTPVGASNLFDHKPSSAHDLHQLRRNLVPLHDSSVASRSNMDQNPSLSDDMAAQEAAARTWQPEVQVRLPNAFRAYQL